MIVGRAMSEACSCPGCRKECERVPGWFSPKEALLAIAAGHAGRLSMVHEGVHSGIAPSIIGHEGEETGFIHGRCAFLRPDGLCEIHDSGFKPVECRTGYACRPLADDAPDVFVMYAMWGSPAGMQALETWRRARMRHPNGQPMFAPDGMMLDAHGNRSIFDDVDK